MAAGALKQSLPSLKRIFDRLRGHLTRERPLIAGSVVALIAGSALRLLEPFPLKIAFDRVITVKSKPRYQWGLGWLDGMPADRVLLIAAVGLVVVTLLRAAADYANRVGFAKLGNRVLTRVRNELFAHVQALPLEFHTSARAGDLVVRVISDVNMLRDVMVTAILPLVANAMVLVGMWAVMFVLSWRLALVGLATVPLLMLTTSLLSGRIRQAARKQRKKEGAMASTAAEAITSMRVVQAFGLGEKFTEAFSSRSLDSQTQDVKAARLSAKLERSVDVLLAIATALVLWFGVRQVRDGGMTSGDLVIFLMYLRRAFNPVQDFAKYTGRLAKAAAAGERVIDLLDRPVGTPDAPGARPAPRLAGAISFENVTFAYEHAAVTAGPEMGQDDALVAPTAARPVLSGFSLDIPAGRTAAIVGPSGAGKSTIASLLLRLYDPQAGRILVDGRDVREFTVDSLRRQIGVVLQDSLLFAASARENIRHGAPQATDEEVEAAARLANAHQFISELPESYDTVLGERGATLSGGQRQRLAIARTAVRQAPILILDEPTTGLDGDNRRAVTDALARVARGRTTLLITHDLSVASRADLIFYLHDGQITESGTHESLLRLGGHYAALHGLQTQSPSDDAAGGGGRDDDDDRGPTVATAAVTHAE